MKIAPRLQALIVKGGWPEALASDWKGQDAEFKALLAVARAADRHLDNDRSVDSFAYDENCLRRALARLERVSKVKP